MQKANGAFSRDLVLAREHLMKKSFLGVAALSVVLGSGGAWAADDATSRCQE
jgi:hypothetical protein